jgi:glutathione peroxidase
VNYKLLFTLLTIIAVGFLATLVDSFTGSKPIRAVTENIYDFKINSLAGKPIDLNAFKGKHIILVNTASKCGYTPQYADLQKLHELYGNRVAVIGFPANNFLWQEPGTANEIEEFCQVNYGVTFTMTEKISVKGSDKHPIYDWLEAKTGKSPSWNFCKYVVSPEGDVLGFFPSTTKPLDKSITDLISR